MNNGKGSRPDFAVSANTATLEAMIRELKEGDVLSYDKMNAALGCNVRKSLMHCIQSARRRTLADGIYTAAIRGEGIMRGTAANSINGSQMHRKRAHSQFRQAKKCLNVAASKFTELPPESKAAVVLEGTLIAMHESIDRDKAQKKLVQAITAANASSQPIPLPVFKAMDAIKE